MRSELHEAVQAFDVKPFPTVHDGYFVLLSASFAALQRVRALRLQSRLHCRELGRLGQFGSISIDMARLDGIVPLVHSHSHVTTHFWSTQN